MRITFQRELRPGKAQDLVSRCSGFDAVVQGIPVNLAVLFDQTLPESRLIEALPELLNVFPIFAGQLCFSDDRLQFDCRNGRVPTEVVHHSETLEHVLEHFQSRSTSNLAITLDAGASLKRGGPVSALRITQFKGGGTSLGVSFHHSLGDAQTLVAFIRTWLDIASGRKPQSLTFAPDRHAYVTERVKDNGLDRPGMREVTPVELARLLYVMTRHRWDTKQTQIFFTSDEITRMRQSLESVAGRRLSDNDALTGHLFSLISDLQPSVQRRQLSVVVNFRRRVGLSDSLMGNMITTLNVDGGAGTPAGKVAGDLRQRLDTFATDHMDYFCNERFIMHAGGHRRAARLLPAGMNPVRGTLLISSFRNQGAYDFDLDGVRPMFVCPVNAPAPFFSHTCEGFHGQGTMYCAMLPKALANALSSEASLRRVHCYRDADEPVPAFVDKLHWIN